MSLDVLICIVISLPKVATESLYNNKCCNKKLVATVDSYPKEGKTFGFD